MNTQQNNADLIKTSTVITGGMARTINITDIDTAFRDLRRIDGMRAFAKSDSNMRLIAKHIVDCGPGQYTF